MKNSPGSSFPDHQRKDGEYQSLASSLSSEISMNKGGRCMAKKSGLRNAPSKTGKPSGKGRSNK